MYKSEIEGRGGIYAKVVADSVANGVRLCTMELNYPRFIHAEFMTHRMFSRNASSSRAIPVKKMLASIEEAPAIPIHWGKNEPGMQASEEFNKPLRYGLNSPQEEWQEAADAAAYHAENFAETGYHKQIVNRITEPFQFIRVVVTATEWDNFFKLRLHPDAQPEIQELACVMHLAMDESTPNAITHGTYHLPYITDEEFLYWLNAIDDDKEDDYRDKLIKASVGRCARVSYLNHDKSNPDLEKDIALYDMLLKAGHMSPFEHVATPMKSLTRSFSYDGVAGWLYPGETHADVNHHVWSGNFRGWVQHRQTL